MGPEIVQAEQIPANPPSSLPPTPGPGKKRWLLILGLIGLGLILVLGAIKFLLARRPGKQASITLTYWGLWEPKAVMEGIIAQWQEQHPNIKINYLPQDKEDYRLRLQTAFSQGQGPDIFRFHQTWGPMLRQDLAPVPQDLVANLGLEKDYFPVIKESLKQGNVFYGIPLMIDTLVLYYNKDILAAANKSPPRTWWGLRQLAQELTVRDEGGKIQIAGAALGTTGNVDHWSDILGLMIFQNEGSPSQPKSQLVSDALRFYTIFYRQDHVWDETLPSSTMAFGQGKVAFYFGPSWRIFNLSEINSNLNFAVTDVPQLPKLKDTDWQLAEEGQAELTQVGWASFWVEGVWVKSRYQKEAWQFLQFLASKEGLQRLYTAQSQIRYFGELYPRTDLARELASNSLLKPFINQAQIAKSWYLASFTYDGGLNDRLIKYYEDAVNALNESGELNDSILTQLDQGVKQILSQYRLKS